MVGPARPTSRTLDLIAGRPFATDVIRESALASVRARRQLDEGRIHEAYRTADRAVRWMQTRGIDPMLARQTVAVGELAAALLERRPDTSAEMLSAVADNFRRHERIGDLVATLIVTARLHVVCGDAGTALRTLGDARELLTRNSPGSPMRSLIDIAEARSRIDTGDVIRAERLIRELPAGQERTLLSVNRDRARHEPTSRSGLPRPAKPATGRRAAPTSWPPRNAASAPALPRHTCCARDASPPITARRSCSSVCAGSPGSRRGCRSPTWRRWLGVAGFQGAPAAGATLGIRTAAEPRRSPAPGPAP